MGYHYDCMRNTIEVEVTREDSDWQPYKYRLVNIKQSVSDNNYEDEEWILHMVYMFSVIGMNIFFKKMKVGDRWKFRTRGLFEYHVDYWGEGMEDYVPEFVKVFQKRKVKYGR